MLLTKQALQAAALIAAIDKPETVYLIDGAVYAINRKAALLISPMTEERAKATPLQNTGACSLGVSAAAVTSVLRLIPSDALFKGLLECADVRISEQSALWTTTDGRRKHESRCATVPHDPALINGLRALWRKKWDSAEPARIAALNFKRMSVLMKAMATAGCSASGEEPLWIRSCSDGTVLLRAINYATHQRALGMCTAYDTEEGKMPEWIAWEKKGGPIKWNAK